MHQRWLHRRFEPALQAQQSDRLGQIEHAGSESGEDKPEDHCHYLAFFCAWHDGTEEVAGSQWQERRDDAGEHSHRGDRPQFAANPTTGETCQRGDAGDLVRHGPVNHHGLRGDLGADAGVDRHGTAAGGIPDPIGAAPVGQQRHRTAFFALPAEQRTVIAAPPQVAQQHLAQPKAVCSGDGSDRRSVGAGDARQSRHRDALMGCHRGQGSDQRIAGDCRRSLPRYLAGGAGEVPQPGLHAAPVDSGACRHPLPVHRMLPLDPLAEARTDHAVEQRQASLARAARQRVAGRQAIYDAVLYRAQRQAGGNRHRAGDCLQLVVQHQPAASRDHPNRTAWRVQPVPGRERDALSGLGDMVRRDRPIAKSAGGDMAEPRVGQFRAAVGRPRRNIVLAQSPRSRIEMADRDHRVVGGLGKGQDQLAGGDRAQREACPRGLAFDKHDHEQINFAALDQPAAAVAVDAQRRRGVELQRCGPIMGDWGCGALRGPTRHRRLTRPAAGRRRMGSSPLARHVCRGHRCGRSPARRSRRSRGSC